MVSKHFAMSNSINHEDPSPGTLNLPEGRMAPAAWSYMGVIAKVRFEYSLRKRIASGMILSLGGPAVRGICSLGFLRLGMNHDTSSGLELVRSGSKPARCIVSSNHLRLIPGYPCSSPPGVCQPGRDLIFSYAATRTSRSAKISVGPANLPLPDGFSSLASFSRPPPVV